MPRAPRPGRALHLGLLALLLLPASAGAVVGVGEVTVQGAEGEPVANATLRWIPPADSGLPEKTVTTDAAGKAAVEVDEGTYTVEVTSSDTVTEQREVVVEGGATTSEQVSVDPLWPWMVQTPPIFGGFGLAGLFWGQSVDWDLGPESEKITITEVANPTNTATMVIKKGSKGRDFSSDFYGGGGEAVVGLPSIPLFGETRLFSGVNVVLGGISSKVDSKHDGSPSFELDGDGLLVGTGVDLVLASPTFPVFALFNYGFKYSDLDIDLDPCSPAATVECMSKFHSDFYSHEFGGQLGYAFRKVAFHAGVGYTTAEIETRAKSTRLIDTTGGLFQVESHLKQKLRRDEVEGIAGVDLRCGPVFLRSETRFNGSDVTTMVKVVLGLGFGGW